MIKLHRFLLVLFFALFFNKEIFSEYQKATKFKETVLNKKYPKSSKLELSGSFGAVLNQAYVNSLVLTGSLSYFLNESWGIHLEALKAINADNAARQCIETFYNDPFNRVGPSCAFEVEDPASPLIDQNGAPIGGANFGPAYVAIRELDMIFNITASWNPIYGKQLAFLSFTNYFDLFLKLGIGLSLSNYYPFTNQLRDEKQTLSRGPLPGDKTTGCPDSPGICPDGNGNYLNYIGKNGRPDPIAESTPTLTFAFGQKFHFLKRYHLNAELRNYSLLFTERGMESFFIIWAGIGVRL